MEPQAIALAKPPLPRRSAPGTRPQRVARACIRLSPQSPHRVKRAQISAASPWFSRFPRSQILKEARCRRTCTPQASTGTPQASPGIKSGPADKAGPHSAQPTKAVHKALHKARPGPQTGWSQSRFRRSHGWSWPAAAQSTARSGCPSPQSSAAAYRW